jgi:hypothetical protein
MYVKWFIRQDSSIYLFIKMFIKFLLIIQHHDRPRKVENKTNLVHIVMEHRLQWNLLNEASYQYLFHSQQK